MCWIIMAWIIQIFFILNLSFFLWQIYLNIRYKSIKIVKDLPNISVIIPAFNEEDCIAETINSVLLSDYPVEKLELIVVNDGSSDNTHNIILETIKDKNVIYLNQTRNKGKRHALYNGIKIAKNDIIVTLDSDSVIDKDTLQKLVSPFVEDETVGAVAGNIIVKNKHHLIPRLLSAAFTFGFKFLRPAQSSLGSVLCTPGALSSYRKNVILSELIHWKNSKFMGHYSNIGEDRALTTIILKNNYKVIYQNNAYCYTNVPITYTGMVKTFIRWIRGDIRESFSIFWFIKNFKLYKHWNFNYFGLIIHLFMQLLWMITPFLLFYYFYMLGFNISAIGIFLYSAFLMTTLWSILPSYICYRNHGLKTAIYSYLYGLMNVFTLFWLIPYCWFTIGKSGWLTRSLRK